MQLTAYKTVTWTGTAPAGVTLDKVYFGPDPHNLGGFQVAVATSTTPPTRQTLRELFVARRGKAQVQLLVVVVHDGQAHLFGPDPQAQPLALAVELAQRQLNSVLDEPDVLAATERLAGFRKASDSGVAGFTNSGLFATHHVRSNLPRRPDWAVLGHEAASLLRLRGKSLIQALGFTAQPGPNGTLILSEAGHPPRAVAVLLDASEHFDAKTARFQLSPVAFGLAIASRQDVPWLVVLRKDQIRIYPGRDGIGVGAKGQVETFFEVDLATIDAEFAALLPLVFSAAALAPDGTAGEILRDSARYSTELGSRLRDRVYERVVPTIAVEVAHQLSAKTGRSPDADDLATAYRVTLHILFRLLFQAYAEDRGLLPSGRNEGFDANSLKTNAARLLDADPERFGAAATIWLDLVQVWNAIDQGNPQWQIPAYNGGLFSADPARSPDGVLIHQIELSDRVLGPALQSLLIDENDDGVLGAVDFRSLSVREFGTIYEGLLGSSLSVAVQDLTEDNEGAWVPARAGDRVLAPAGSIYFHTASGERKATGSYFTPKVVVDHLIERSVVPPLAAHLDRIAAHLAEGDAVAAAREFFDFRVADLAMGSGHFLVAAVDKIEAMMRTFLTEHAVPGVTDELRRLADAAKGALGSDDVAKSEVDEIGLLRRQVARRCIYGIDINAMAVELARLALWIHTFVPGLPMSNLDHGLVHANSLTGIGSIEEAVVALSGASPSASAEPEDEAALRDEVGGDAALFADDGRRVRRQSPHQKWFRGVVEQFLERARPILLDVAAASEATKAEVESAAQMLAKAREAAEPARRIFNAAVAKRLGELGTDVSRPEHIQRLIETDSASPKVAALQPAHMPYLFPEVFLRDDPGFDAVVGNPPFDKVRWEAAPFWAKVSPGLMALPASQRDARIEALRQERPVEAARETVEVAERRELQGYYKKAFEWRGGTHLELAQLMLERALKSVKPDGGLGLVLPRQALVLAGWQHLRRELFARHSVMLVQARNAGGWLFEDIDGRLALLLLAASPWSDDPVRVAVVTSPTELRAVDSGPVIELTSAELAELSDSMVVPWFESADDKRVFDKMRKFSRLSQPGSWVQGVHDARWDFRGSGPDHGLVTTAETPGAWRVMMTRHVDAFAIRDAAVKQFLRDFGGLAAKSRGVGADKDGRPALGNNHPVVIFRHPSRSDDTRTLIASALPSAGYLHNKGYVHAVAHVAGSSPTALLALVGLLNTSTEDWWARRFVDRHVTAPVINNLPLPKLTPADLSALAARTAVLLHNAGLTMLAGGIDTRAVASGSPYATESRERLLAALEATVAHGYGLGPDDLEVIRRDFGDQGMPDVVFALAQEMLASGDMNA